MVVVMMVITCAIVMIVVKKRLLCLDAITGSDLTQVHRHTVIVIGDATSCLVVWRNSWVRAILLDEGAPSRCCIMLHLKAPLGALVFLAN